MARPRKRKRKSKRKKSRRKTARRSLWLWLFVIPAILLVGYIAFLDFQVRSQFTGKRWSLPARVYARPLELYAGQSLSADQFATELKALQYRPVRSATQAGQYSRNANKFHLLSRPFDFRDGREPAQNLRVTFTGDSISRLADGSTGTPISLARLDPVLVGSFYPSHNEDRVLLQLDEVPVALTDALIAVEDRGFYRHHGVAPLAIVRAMWANIRARGVVQGGSTLTQQLVKNFFLTSERTLVRKINEAFMALLLEWHYDKDEILEAYLNEVYLGQDGKRSINGFGLASYFYFERPLAELTVEQYALLVGLVKGPSYYNPRRHPERARDRRNLVLDVMVQLDLLEADTASGAKLRGLMVSDIGRKAINTFPAFLELVRHQLQRDYRDEDITSEGLRIFTTLDPLVQLQLEQVMASRLKALENNRGIEAGTLEGAAVITSVQGGEVVALAGGRDPGFAGFNRALNAQRHVGSLLKPAVYLTALEQPQRYTLATLIDDSPLSFTSRTGAVWEPHNYDKEDHGWIPLYHALAHSYNVATARLGLELGIDSVISTLRRLGIEEYLNPYPSLVLGAVDLSPLQVTRMYQTLASGGFRMPLRAISAVLAADKTPLQSYPLKVQSVIDPAAAQLVTNAMQYAVRDGTGQAIFQALPAERFVAGKTGTTDDLRDSWFAGFTAERLGVVWIGHDDNQAIGLTGSSGALLVWRDLFSRFNPVDGSPPAAEGIEYQWIDPVSGHLADANCANAVQLPFISGSAPRETAPCKVEKSPVPGTLEWFRGLKGLFE